MAELLDGDRHGIPFLLVAALGVVLAPVAGSGPVWETALAGGLLLALALAEPRLRRSPLGDRTDLVGALVLLGAGVLLRDAQGGAYATLLLLPALWVSLFASLRQLVLILAATAVALGIPLLAYSTGAEINGAVLALAVGAVAGVVVHALGRERRLSEQRARLAVERAYNAFVAIDEDGRVTAWNPAAERAFGWTEAEVTGRELAELIIPERHRAAHREGLRLFREQGSGRVIGRPLELSGLDRTGREFPVELTISAVRLGERVGFNAFIQDISERERARAYLTAGHMVTLVLAEATLLEGALSRVLSILGRELGWQVAAFWAPAAPDAPELKLLEVWWEGSDQDDREQELHRFAQLSRQTALGPGSGLPWVAWAEGRVSWSADVAAQAEALRSGQAAQAGLHGAYALPVRLGAERHGVLELFSRDVARPDEGLARLLGTVTQDLAAWMERLRRSDLLIRAEEAALTDPLTGLANRRALARRLSRELSRAQRDVRPLCVAFVDLDGFKAFNDLHGHLEGDRLLRELAAAWSGRLRASDLLARLGGDEFAVLLPECEIEEAHDLARRLRDATLPPVTASAGLAQWHMGEDAETLMQRADDALYEAKRAGRDRVMAAEE